MRHLLLVASLVLGGCHKDEPPAPTPEQSAQLNDAEDMLNAEAANAAPPNSADQSNTAQ